MARLIIEVTTAILEIKSIICTIIDLFKLFQYSLCDDRTIYTFQKVIFKNLMLVIWICCTVLCNCRLVCVVHNQYSYLPRHVQAFIYLKFVFARKNVCLPPVPQTVVKR
jgi:Cu/Ag efflux pump CusA